MAGAVFDRRVDVGRWWRSVLVLVVAGVLVGCSATSAGTPTTVSAGPGDETVPTTRTVPRFAPPPVEIRLDELNPCLVWTEAQRDELGLQDEPSPNSPARHPLGGGLSCGWYTPRGVEPELLWAVTTYPNFGLAELWSDRPRRLTHTAIEVAGFAAIQESGPLGALDACTVLLGVAEDQVLLISIRISPNPFSVEEACSMVVTAAEMALDTLRAT